MKPIKSRFTLVEMLAVVAIASILIALITPSVQKMLFGNTVDQCTSNLKLALEQAQSKAVASRKYVALILPTDHSKADVKLKTYCKSGYRMAFVKKESNEIYKFANWIPGSEWKNPNNGAMLANITADSPGDTASTREAWAETVKGKLTSAEVKGRPAKLSDIYHSGVSDPDLNALGDDGDGNPNVQAHCAIIFSPYGGIVNNDQPLYFTVTECKYNGSDYYELENPDNFLVLKLNAITGRVTYFDPYAE